MNFIAEILAAIGMGVANGGSQGSYWWIFDEPKMPKALLDK